MQSLAKFYDHAVDVNRPFSAVSTYLFSDAQPLKEADLYSVETLSFQWWEYYILRLVFLHALICKHILKKYKGSSLAIRSLLETDI